MRQGRGHAEGQEHPQGRRQRHFGRERRGIACAGVHDARDVAMDVTYNQTSTGERSRADSKTFFDAEIATIDQSNYHRSRDEGD